MFVTSSLLVDVMLLWATLTFCLYKYFIRNFNYWTKRGVPGPKPTAFIGNFGKVFCMKVTALEWLQNLCEDVAGPYIGVFVFDEPCLAIKDPMLVKDILVTNFATFCDRSVAVPEHDELVQEMLFVQRNPKWRITRSKITPAFTSAKLKGTFRIMNEIGDNFKNYMKNFEGEMEDVRNEITKYALEVISQSIFGIQAKCFEKENTEFYRNAVELSAFNFRNVFVQLMYFFRQKWTVKLKLDFNRKYLMDYFTNIFMETLALREFRPKQNDFIDIVLELKRDQQFSKDMEFEGKKVGSQALNLFLAGYDTTSSTISFLLYETSLNLEIQNKLREEIQVTIEKHGEFSYDALVDMKYLDMCICEVLRKYPVLPFLDRTCNADYKLPGTDLVVEKGMTVYISIGYLHHNESYFPDPQAFIPERFGEEGNFKANGMVYLPFGGGPRTCVGERFALLSAKIAICKLLMNFRFLPNPKTPKCIKYGVKSIFPKSDVGLPMTIQRL